MKNWIVTAFCMEICGVVAMPMNLEGNCPTRVMVLPAPAGTLESVALIRTCIEVSFPN